MLYGYAGNSSSIYIDPSGLYSIIGGIIGAISGGIAGGAVGSIITPGEGLLPGIINGAIAGCAVGVNSSSPVQALLVGGLVGGGAAATAALAAAYTSYELLISIFGNAIYNAYGTALTGGSMSDVGFSLLIGAVSGLAAGAAGAYSSGLGFIGTTVASTGVLDFELIRRMAQNRAFEVTYNEAMKVQAEHNRSMLEYQRMCYTSNHHTEAAYVVNVQDDGSIEASILKFQDWLNSSTGVRPSVQLHWVSGGGNQKS